jgi:phosphatidate cytidylyltransferase
LAQDQADPPPPVKAPAWRDLRVRVASAAVLGPLCLLALWVGGPVWNGLIVVLAIGMAVEWWSMCGHGGVGYGARVLFGVCYLAPASLALIWLRGDVETGRACVLFIILVVWASDIGAYLAGRLIGGPRLAPRISPGKTWSGAIGGFAAAVAVGLVAANLEPDGVPVSAMLVAGCLGIASQLGDLLESALKRRFGVKDSGRLIPGHGGLLDRLDGVLFAAPVAAVVILALGRGMRLWQ